jgi:hypothetical protein
MKRPMPSVFVKAARFATWRRVLLAACAFIGIAACKSKGAQGTRQAEETLESVAQEVGLVFPVGSRLVGVHRERGADDLIAVKIDMPAAAWPIFVATTPIDPSLFRAGERGLLGPDDGFWDPHRCKNLRTAESPLPHARVLNLGYDDSRGNVFAVYVVNHGT